MASQPCLHNLSCLGSTSSCRQRLPFGSSLYCLKPALRARFMLSLLGLALRLCLSGHLRLAASSVILARLLACMHAHATTHMHAPTVMAQPTHCCHKLTHTDCPGSALQRRLLAPHCTRGSERFFELLTSCCRRVDTLVDFLYATQCLQRDQ